MKIAILGVGTASSVSTMWMLNNLPRDVEVHCFHNPNIPTAHVGESASAALGGLLYETVRFDFLKDLGEFDGTLRWCTKYWWKAAHGEDFTIRYAAPGLHVNSEKFSWFVFGRLQKYFDNFTLTEENVKDISQTDSKITVHGEKGNYDFDYVIDCRGTPSREELASEDYLAPEFTSVNSVILFPEFKKYDEPWTSSYIHDNGWMFGVPLQHRKAWGYLYNNTVTTQQEAQQAFSELKGIDTEPLRKFSWTPYYRREAMTSRLFAMGNRLYFFEPHQAMPLHFYIMITKEFCRLLTEVTDPWVVTNLMNIKYRREIEELQDLIAINYAGENQLETPFWTYAKEKSRARLQGSRGFQDWASYVKQHGYTQYMYHGGELMREYIEGYKITL